jgi:antitoxin component YwqK of YwqJK toxin-antitoxin module
VFFFSQGAMDGMSFSLDQQGRLKKVVDHYVAGQIEGVVCDLYPDGSVKTLTRYSGGEVVGPRENFRAGERASDYDWAISALEETLAETNRNASSILKDFRNIE